MAMKVTVDSGRIAHLAVLVGCSYLLGKFLVNRWEMSRLSGYGLGCYMVCQVNAVVTRVVWPSDDSQESPRAEPPAKKNEKHKNRKKRSKEG